MTNFKVVNKFSTWSYSYAGFYLCYFANVLVMKSMPMCYSRQVGILPPSQIFIYQRMYRKLSLYYVNLVNNSFSSVPIDLRRALGLRSQQNKLFSDKRENG